MHGAQHKAAGPTLGRRPVGWVDRAIPWGCAILWGCGLPNPGQSPDDAGEDDSATEMHVEDDASQDADGIEADETCIPEPAGESCNGIDDDCDGVADEDLMQVLNPGGERLSFGPLDDRYLPALWDTAVVPDGLAFAWYAMPKLVGGVPGAPPDPHAYLTMADGRGVRVAGPVVLTPADADREPTPMGVAWTGTDVALVFTTGRAAGLEREVVFARVSADAELVLPPVAVLTVTQWSSLLELINVGGAVGALHAVGTFGLDPGIEYFRAGLDGSLDLVPRVVASQPPSVTCDVGWTSAWNGSQIGVAWCGRLFRFDRDGDAVGSPTPFHEYAGQGHVGWVAWDGGAWGIAWEDCCGAATEPCEHSDIAFARFDDTGTAVGDARCVRGESWREHLSGLTWTGSEYGLTWADGRNIASAPECGMLTYLQRLGQDRMSIQGEIGVVTGCPPSGSGGGSVAWVGGAYSVFHYDQLLTRVGCGE